MLTSARILCVRAQFSGCDGRISKSSWCTLLWPHSLTPGRGEKLAALCLRNRVRLADKYGFVAPTLVTYNTVISACAKGGMWAEAKQLADSMAAEGIAKDAFTLSALVRTLPDGGCCNSPPAVQLGERSQIVREAAACAVPSVAASMALPGR